MDFIGEWMRRLMYLIHRRRNELELQREMETHRAMMDEPQHFGNSLRLREEAQDAWGWNWLDAAWRDSVYAIRSLLKTPGFTITAVVILGIGIGVNLAFFQIVNVTALHPLAVHDPGSLVRFDRIWRNGSMNSISRAMPYPAIQFLRENNNVLSAVLTETTLGDMVWGDDPTDHVRASFVSRNWFDELGCTAAYGRLFRDEREVADEALPGVVLGELVWTRRFDRDPQVIGKAIRMDGRPAVVIGIAPRRSCGLTMQQDTQVWIPIDRLDYFAAGSKFKTNWSFGGPELYARLRPGVSPAVAKESLRVSMNELAAQHPDDFHAGEWLEPYSGAMYYERPDEHQLRLRTMALVASLFILVLLIACANLSSVVLSRGLTRIRELSIRTALGAGAWRIVMHLLAESICLAFLGAAAGTAFGYWAFNTLAAHLQAQSWLQWSLDWNTASATFAAAGFAMAAVGLIPAWKIMRRRMELASAIKDGGQQTSAALNRTRLRQVLIAIQIAGSCLLLVIAGGMVRRLEGILADPGFDFSKVAVLKADFDRLGLKGQDARAYWEDVKAQIAPLSEVKDLSLVYPAPLGGGLTTSEFPDARDVEVSIIRIEPDFFQVMDIPILAGRTFAPSDDYRTSVIISKRLALRMYNTVAVSGLGFPRSRPERTIIGVAGDARLFRLDRLTDAEAYFPLNPERLAGASLIVRARAAPELLLSPLRQIGGTGTGAPPDAHLMLQDFDNKVDSHRTMSLIAVSLSGLALALACIGIFGLLSYSISVRTKEIGIRMALGAARSSIVVLVTSQLLWPASVGMACGVAGGLLTSKLMESQAPFLKAADGFVLGSVLGIFVTAAGIASLLPAVRAMRTDILSALRYE